ncbi:Hypothetical protein GOX1609 [Gluconobacter oxydans 621H]|uniref:Uncharacterized protein n=1 Tax=Gluconobacter oxydans (strain 621H) TaxID=290633 RepID=Q5FQJ6_GLUOX|nr:Hypothetical protein GOX1609 [Gluconobacter oxydans 621H]
MLRIISDCFGKKERICSIASSSCAEQEDTRTTNSSTPKRCISRINQARNGLSPHGANALGRTLSASKEPDTPSSRTITHCRTVTPPTKSSHLIQNPPAYFHGSEIIMEIQNSILISIIRRSVENPSRPHAASAPTNQEQKGPLIRIDPLFCGNEHLIRPDDRPAVGRKIDHRLLSRLKANVSYNIACRDRHSGRRNDIRPANFEPRWRNTRLDHDLLSHPVHFSGTWPVISRNVKERQRLARRDPHDDHVSIPFSRPVCLEDRLPQYVLRPGPDDNGRRVVIDAVKTQLFIEMRRYGVIQKG